MTTLCSAGWGPSGTVTVMANLTVPPGNTSGVLVVLVTTSRGWQARLAPLITVVASSGLTARVTPGAPAAAP